MEYQVNGSVNMRGRVQKFSIKVDAQSERHARDKVMSFLGSVYHIKRRNVDVREVRP